jgi:hypothetical protein
VLHGLASAVTLALLGIGWLACMLLIPLVASLISWLRMSGLAVSGRGPVRACWHEDGSWTLIDRRGRAAVARLAAGGYCSPRLILLNWRQDDGHAVSALLRPGLADPEEMRRLRSRLRCGDAF